MEDDGNGTNSKDFEWDEEDFELDDIA